MKILAVENRLTTFRGGSERSYFDVLSGLRSAGHEVSIVYSEDGNLLESYKNAGVKTYQQSYSLLMRKGSKWKDLLSLWRTVSFIKNTIRPDVVYLNFTEAIPLAALIRLRLRIPIVCHIRIGYFGLSRQILWLGRLVRTFIVINKKFQPVFENVFKAQGRVVVVYNGIAIPSVLSSPRSRTAKSPLRILYLGRIAPEKGVVELVRSFAAARRKGVDATLQITGTYLASYLGDFKKELDDVIAETGTSNVISIEGPTPVPIDYISKYDLHIFPSTWDEGFGRTIPESIIAGTPILARDVGMVKEMMADNLPFVFETDDALTEKIVAFWEGKLNFNFEASRKRVATDFNKDRMVAEVERSLVGQKQNQP